MIFASTRGEASREVTGAGGESNGCGGGEAICPIQLATNSHWGVSSAREVFG
jgi:hypothetical protein